MGELTLEGKCVKCEQTWRGKSKRKGTWEGTYKTRLERFCGRTRSCTNLHGRLLEQRQDDCKLWVQNIAITGCFYEVLDFKI